MIDFKKLKPGDVILDGVWNITYIVCGVKPFDDDERAFMVAILGPWQRRPLSYYTCDWYMIIEDEQYMVIHD